MRAEFAIRKISNGYIISINGKETFCDTPEAICGETSTWVLGACAQADKAPADSEDAAFDQAFKAIAAEMQKAEARKSLQGPLHAHGIASSTPQTKRTLLDKLGGR